MASEPGPAGRQPSQRQRRRPRRAGGRAVVFSWATVGGASPRRPAQAHGHVLLPRLAHAPLAPRDPLALPRPRLRPHDRLGAGGDGGLGAGLRAPPSRRIQVGVGGGRMDVVWGGGVVELRVWCEHVVLKPVGPSRGSCARSGRTSIAARALERRPCPPPEVRFPKRVRSTLRDRISLRQRHRAGGSVCGRN